MWRNTGRSFGLGAIVLHWLVALAVVGLFALGMWMVDLTYYDPWYRQAPDIHRSVGVLLFGVLALRIGWRVANPRPRAAPGVSPLEDRLSRAAHWSMDALILVVVVSGYLISTADGKAIDVFGLFSVPATFVGPENQADLAGKLHWYLALALMGLAGLHTLAALKHHFIDRNRTLMRMIRPGG
ncbi:MAG: cytochrome b [Chromatiales bacterium]|jgi:cytochrome b561